MTESPELSLLLETAGFRGVVEQPVPARQISRHRPDLLHGQCGPRVSNEIEERLPEHYMVATIKTPLILIPGYWYEPCAISGLHLLRDHARSNLLSNDPK
jgi:hypothetical protein